MATDAATRASSSDGGNQFASLVWKAQRQCRHRGIIEISESHRLYHVSRCIQMGIRGCIDGSQHYVEEINTKVEDYQEVTVKKHFEKDVNKHFEFRCYAPKVFSSLRALVGITEAEFLESLSPSGLPLPCLEFITSSKSGMDFFLSNNKAFIMKTEKSSDISFLREHYLRRLVRHFHDYPHSLLVKILGCYYIKMNGNKGLYFTVMQSVFYPDDRITERYDIKGCSASRYVEPLEDGSNEVIVLKDNNFAKKIKIGGQTSWFIKQVDIDTKLLEGLGIMDYSLLIGVQKLHADEKKTTNKLLDVVSRARRSIQPIPGSPNRICPDCNGRMPSWNRRSHIQSTYDQPCTTPPPSGKKTIDETEETDRLVQEILDIDVKGTGRHHDPADGNVSLRHSENQISDKTDIGGNRSSSETKRKETTFASEEIALPGMIAEGNHHREHTTGSQPDRDNQQHQRDTSESGLSETNSRNLEATSGTRRTVKIETTFCQCKRQFQTDKCDERNQRLLPDTPNPLHIIDGNDTRYYMGIIDVLTQYSMWKKMEHVYKCLRYPTRTFSTVSPKSYRKRFGEVCCGLCE